MDEEQSKKIDSDSQAKAKSEGAPEGLEEKVRAMHAAQENRRQEASFFDPNQVDPELMELAQERSRGSLLRPILMVAVIFFGLSLLNDWRDQLGYFFTSSTPVELGSITDYPVEMAENPEWKAPLIHNRYVTLGGVPTRRSQSEKYDYFKLVGAEVYVEAPREDLPQSAIQRVMTEDQPKKLSDTDRTFYRGTGRLVALPKTTDRYGGLRSYYTSRYDTRFCEQYDERGIAEIARSRREAILLNWALEYERATPEQRTKGGLHREPTTEEMDDIFNSEPLCVNAYLFQEGTAPKNHWWNIALAVLIGCFVAFNAVNLVRWVIRFVKP